MLSNVVYALQAAIRFVCRKLTCMFYSIHFFFSMVASVIALAERADQKCMRWIESEGFQ